MPYNEQHKEMLQRVKSEGGQLAAGTEATQNSPELKKGAGPPGSDNESLVAAAQLISTEKLK